MRLDALLARALGCSRSQATRAIRAGRVRVDGAAPTSGKLPIGPEHSVTCDGEAVAVLPDPLHLLLHKPVGVACSRDPREAPLLHDLLPPAHAKLVEPVGRLDRATSGLLLLTSDGRLAHRLTHPNHHVAKRYRIAYHGELAADAVARCAAGIRLPDDERPCRPAELELHPAVDGLARATLIIQEGRYHQVRRMVAVLGGEVVDLHRDRIGALELPPDLAGPGSWREATEREIDALSAAATPGP